MESDEAAAFERLVEEKRKQGFAIRPDAMSPQNVELRKFFAIVHAYLCLEKEACEYEDLREEAKSCNLFSPTTCSEIKQIIIHSRNCQAGSSCSFKGCPVVQRSLSHFENCKNNKNVDCPKCGMIVEGTLYDIMDPNRMVKFMFKYKGEGKNERDLDKC